MAKTTKTYTELMQDIARLQQEAEQRRREEADSVVERIKEAIDAYGLTASDLGFGREPAPSRQAGGRKAAQPGGKKSNGAFGAKYRDDEGNTWGGRGPRPYWLRDALARGKQLSDFAV